MYSYSQPQIFSMLYSHQEMYAGQQLNAGFLFHQYNHHSWMRHVYPYHPIYRGDQLVSQTSPPVQLNPQDLQRSSVIQISSPNAWLMESSVSSNSDVFHPISCVVSQTMLAVSSDSEDEYAWQPVHFKSSNEQVSNNIDLLSAKNTQSMSRPELIKYIDENLIGRDQVLHSPFGQRLIIYCDYTASGRSLEFIENYIKSYVLPLYGNAHSETSLVAQQSTKFREEARNIIRKSVNANDDDAVIFTGSGATGAIHKLIDTFDFPHQNNQNQVIVMVSALEHHSNILPWKEQDIEIIRIPTTEQGLLDKSFLKEQLQIYSELKRRIICSFNAASNVTGILTDTDSISTLVHSYSGLIFWDYATAAPYVKIDMNSSSTAYKDAIFISTHKFVGGPGSPGILIAKKNLFTSKPPKMCGGGTVNFVTRTCREYISDIETREEGGTPDIIGCIRAGLAFQLKDAIDIVYIQTREEKLVQRFYRRFSKSDRLILLGSQTVARLPIFSFITYVPSVCKYLHPHFVGLMFNDLFGIQVRSGCACAGPYALDLLNILDEEADMYCKLMSEDAFVREEENMPRTMIMKPGFTRLNLPYFASDDEIEYILNAIEFVVTHGWKFLPLYTYDPLTGAWSHRSGLQLSQSSLNYITYNSGQMEYHGPKIDFSSTRREKVFSNALRDAKLLAIIALKQALETVDYTSDPPLNLPKRYKDMVRFALPIDIVMMILKQKGSEGDELPCDLHFVPFVNNDTKRRMVNSRKTKHGRETSTSRKKRNSNRSLSASHVWPE